MSFPLTLSKKYIMIEEFKDEIKGLKNILSEIKKTRIVKRIRNNWNKKKIMLDDEINSILEKLDVDLINLEPRCKFLEKPHDFEEEEIEIRISKKKKKKNKWNKKTERGTWK